LEPLANSLAMRVLRNMSLKSVTWLTSHADRSWLNEAAALNMSRMFVTADVSHSSGWLNR